MDAFKNKFKQKEHCSGFYWVTEIRYAVAQISAQLKKSTTTGIFNHYSSLSDRIILFIDLPMKE